MKRSIVNTFPGAVVDLTIAEDEGAAFGPGNVDLMHGIVGGIQGFDLGKDDNDIGEGELLAVHAVHQGDHGQIWLLASTESIQRRYFPVAASYFHWASLFLPKRMVTSCPSAPPAGMLGIKGHAIQSLFGVGGGGFGAVILAQFSWYWQSGWFR